MPDCGRRGPRAGSTASTTSTARPASTTAGRSSAGSRSPTSSRSRSSMRLEAAQTSRAPRFVFFPTISTHFPFIPTPPYQPDWSACSSNIRTTAVDRRAYAQQPDWTHFGPGYVNAIGYDYATLAGYLRLHADRDFVMILLGDHEPAAAVSGEKAPWGCAGACHRQPSRILERLRARGFRGGLTPARPSLGACTRCCRSCRRPSARRALRAKKKPRRPQRTQRRRRDHLSRFSTASASR